MPPGSRGFTLVEVLVALVLLGGGVLAAAAGLSAVARLVRAGHDRTVAAALLSGQLEILRGQGCPAPGAGEQPRGRLVVAWAVSPVAAGRRLTAAVTSPGRRVPRVDALTTVMLCP